MEMETYLVEAGLDFALTSGMSDHRQWSSFRSIRDRHMHKTDMSADARADRGAYLSQP